jgi:hypothetical protein
LILVEFLVDFLVGAVFLAGFLTVEGFLGPVDLDLEAGFLGLGVLDFKTTLMWLVFFWME